jgi:hypothetical protein
MNKIFSSYFIVVGVVFVLLSMPQSIFAAELIFKVVPNTVVNDNTIIVEVLIDPQSKKLNVIEGAIGFSGIASDNLSVQVENGQSILPLWPTPPQYVESEKTIRFAGGVPGGFDSEGLLFSMRLSSTSYGDIDISYVNGSAYLNDGKGTKESISSESLKILIDKDGYNKIIGVSSGLAKLKSVIITLIGLVVIFFAYKYGYRKIIKK